MVSWLSAEAARSTEEAEVILPTGCGREECS